MPRNCNLTISNFPLFLDLFLPPRLVHSFHWCSCGSRGWWQQPGDHLGHCKTALLRARSSFLGTGGSSASTLETTSPIHLGNVVPWRSFCISHLNLWFTFAINIHSPFNLGLLDVEFVSTFPGSRVSDTVPVISENYHVRKHMTSGKVPHKICF